MREFYIGITTIVIIMSILYGISHLFDNGEKELKIGKTFIDLCEKNGGLMLDENFFGKITKSKCYYNDESFSYWFTSSELKLKNKILIDNYKKNGK